MKSIDLRDPKEPPDQLRLLLHACDASIHGTIRDSTGGPVRARISQSEGIGVGGTEADEEGRYELCVPIGYSTVMLKADGYASIQTAFEVFGRIRRDFAMVPEASVVGRVVRADDQAPVPGASLELQSDDWGSNVTTLYASSDDEGRFRITGVAPGRHRLTATANRLAMVRPMSVVAEIGNEDPVVCALTRTFVISGNVVEAETKHPLAGETVQVSPRRQITNRFLRTTSRSDGGFVIGGVLSGEFDISAGEQRSLPITVGDRDLADIVITIQRRASISGRVIRAGKPVDDAFIRTDGAFTRTDSDGRFSLRVAPGSHELYAESTRLGAFTRSRIVVTKEEQKTVVLELDLAGSISGVVVDQDDKPISGAVLRFSLLRATDYGIATTADDGSFIARGLSGGGDYVYEIRPSSESPTIFKSADGNRPAPIAVRDGQTQVTGVRLRVRFERFSIAGRVLSSKGAPVPDAVVRAFGKLDVRSPLGTATTDMSGMFAIRDLTSGTYTLHAESLRIEERLEAVVAGRSDVVIRLPEAGGIEGTIEGFDDLPTVFVTRSDRENRGHVVTITANTFRLRGITPGKYEITATSPNGFDSTTVDVIAGANLSVVMRNRGTGSVAGTVVEETSRTPLVGLRCVVISGVTVLETTTDAAGLYRFDRVLAAPVRIRCSSANSDTHAFGSVTVVAGETTRADLTAPKPIVVRRGYAGLGLEVQLSEIHVKSVIAGGPAARAGVLVGDVLLQVHFTPVDGRDILPYGTDIESHPIGSTVKLTIERADKQHVVLLTIEAAP